MPDSNSTAPPLGSQAERIDTEDQCLLAHLPARDLLDLLMENLPDAIYFKDKSSRFVRVNQAVADHVGCVSADDVIGKTDLDFFPAGAAEDFFAEERQLFASGEPVADILEHHLYPGRPEAWTLGTKVPVRDASGEIVGLVGINRDVTSLKQAEAAAKASEQRFRDAFEAAAIGMALVALDGRWLRVNWALCQAVGYSEAELLTRTFQEITHPDDLDADLSQVKRLLDGQITSYQMEKRYFHKDGSTVWVLLSVSLARNEHGEPRYFVAQVQDVTQHKLSEAALKDSERKLRLALAAANMLSWTWDIRTDELEHVGDLFSLYGEHPSTTEFERIDTYYELVHPDDRERYRANDLSANASGDRFEIEFRIVRPDGEIRWLRDVGQIERDESGVAIRQHGVTMDITERKELEERLRQQAFTDALTGLPNRAFFATQLDDALVEASSAGNSVALLFLDLDGFKHINDSLGHSTGDQLLVAVGRRLRAMLRSVDVVARLGGDEFTVIMRGVASLEDAQIVAERIVEELRPPFQIDDQQLFITSSVGIALSRPGDQADDLLRRSDLAMYGAKQRGRARYTVFDPSMDIAVFERLTREAELRSAVESGQLALHYQPIIDLESGDVCAFEALARWEHPERGVLPAPEFIPLAEETGLIIPIGRWVLAEACRQLRSWEQAGLCSAGVQINVNLSARQLSEPSLVNDVARVLLATGLNPDQLQLEITETTAMDESEETAEALRTLRNLGVRLAIDDFGAGFSAFSYLRRCPVDTLKIDRSFVSGLGQNPEDERIVEAVIAFSKTLGLDVVGEGIETADQAARLYKLGCENGQGFLFAHPLAPALIESALIHNRRHGGTFADVSRIEGQAPESIEMPVDTGVRWTA